MAFASANSSGGCDGGTAAVSSGYLYPKLRPDLVAATTGLTASAVGPSSESVSMASQSSSFSMADAKRTLLVCVAPLPLGLRPGVTAFGALALRPTTGVQG